MPTTPDAVPVASAAPAYRQARERRLHELFDECAESRGTAIAARHRGTEISYARLRRYSDALAARLVRAGVRRGTPVGVCGRRSPEALMAFLGTLKAGGCYVPLDDDLPPARLRAMAEDADVRTVVVLEGSTCRVRGVKARVELPSAIAEGGPAATDASTDLLPVSGTATDPAYVMFTSGSSGRPKPVVVPHRGVVRLVLSEPELPPPGPDDVVLHGYALSSDASTIEIWSALLGGACLELVDREELVSPPALAQRLHGVTVAFLTTSVFHHMARSAPTAFSGLRFLSAGGEALDAGLARTVMRACPRTTLVNFYGPTENSVVSTFHPVCGLSPDAVSVPIGRPHGASTCHVLRADGTEATDGEAGELAVGGDGLALGYFGDVHQTAERFVHVLAAPDALVYRTGDRVVRRNDGVLEYLGRLDRQLKIRGNRVEPEEVEARLRAHRDVGEAVVELAPDESTLLAFVTAAAHGKPPAPDRVRRYCAQWLPASSVPKLTVLDSFPMTAAGKIDRKALRSRAPAPDPAVPTARAPSDHDEPLHGAGDTADGELVRQLADVWTTVLRVRPAADDDFFDLGGDSLLAAEIVNRTLTTLGLAADHGTGFVRALMAEPTLAAYARAVRRACAGARAGTPGTDIGFVREAELGFRFPGPTGPAPCPHHPREVLVTGTTGFLGSFLLDRLMRTTTARVHCLVRARDTEHARRRIRSALDRYDLDPSQASSHRVAALPYDLASPGLGLEPSRTRWLSGHLDLILHSAAQVNFLYPYAALRDANVGGTREIIRLAAPRRVPVHFLSTVAVLAGFGTAGIRTVAEDEPLAHADRLTMGYAESKWVAERLLANASEAGLPTAVHRPYEITGDSRTGACNTETAICSLFKMVAETGLAPDIALPMDFVPVDHIAAAILHIATQRPADGRTYHLTNPRPALLSNVLTRMEAVGFDLRRLPYAQWVDALVQHVARNPTSATAPFVSLCVDRGRKADISVKEMYLQDVFPQLTRDNTETALHGSGLLCPPVDTPLIDRYLRYLLSSGYLPRPSP